MEPHNIENLHNDLGDGQPSKNYICNDKLSFNIIIYIATNNIQ